jgi:DNA-binding response OmpR family regulator
MSEKKKVLLLDDTEDAVILQKVVLESSGYEVKSAVNGIDGLKLLKNYTPDIIISDVLMPKMDGFEFCRKVKEDVKLKDIPFIFYSAQYTDINDKKLADELGAERFIIKPIDIDKFIAIIKEVLEKNSTVAADTIRETEPEIKEFDEKHYMVQAKMLDKKLKELKDQHQKLLESEARCPTILCKPKCRTRGLYNIPCH